MTSSQVQVSDSTEETTGVPEGYEEYYQEDGTVNYESVNETYGEILGEIFKETYSHDGKSWQGCKTRL